VAICTLINRALGRDNSVEEPELGADAPPVASTDRRATIAWWVVFCGPVVVAASVGLAGIIAGDGMAAVWTFTVGVWALTLTIGVAAAPKWNDAVWWAKALLGSFVAAAAGLALIFGVSSVGVEVRNDLVSTTTTAPHANGAPTTASTSTTSTPLP
jgi:hypothetical protein